MPREIWPARLDFPKWVTHDIMNADGAVKTSGGNRMVRPAQQRRRTRTKLAALLLVAPASLALAAEDGSTLYTRYCAQCHDSAGRAPPRDVLAQRPKAEILRSLEGGLMREQGEKRTPEERELLAAFLVGENPAAAVAAENAAEDGAVLDSPPIRW